MHKHPLNSLLFGLALCITVPNSIQSAERFRETAKGLDQMIAKADFKTIIPHLADVLKMDVAAVRKAMLDERRKLSSIAFARLVAEKTGKPVATILQNSPEPEWARLLQELNISEKETEEYLDGVYSEVAFLMLDHRGKGKR